MTIAARACPSYESVTANLARNDVQESLRDLGANTLYRPGQAIDPQLEDRGQPQCRPLPNWRFTLGHGYRSKAVSGPWGALSIITRPFADEIVTRDSIPLLDSHGESTGRTIAGATRIELSREQASLAAATSSLWIQGGTTTDPVLDGTYPGQYGFAALRCSIDNYNGDNVEWISFPQGATHVFCYAYYVEPPPTSGTIVIRKEVDGTADTATRPFHFDGGLSYQENGEFTLTAAPGRPASQTFYRAAGMQWNVRELQEPGWALRGVDCDSQLGASTSAIADESVAIRLGAGDTVTCTYRNAVRPPAGGLILGKATYGATGRTRLSVTGQGTRAETDVTTTELGRAEFTSFPQFQAGDVEIAERPVDRPGGRWVRREVRCGGRILDPFTDPLKLTLTAGTGAVCVYANEFVPSGSIRVRKAITGVAAGRTGFTIRRVDADPPELYEQAAVVSRGETATAVGDSTERLQLGTYDIQETTPPGRGSWRLDSVICNGVPIGSAQGRTRIRLTADDPDMTCTFIDSYSRTPPDEPGPPDRPGPSPPGDGDGEGPRARSDPSPHTNLRITKRVSPTRVVRGRPARYTVTIRNTSSVTAQDVVATELQPRSNRIVAIDAPRGVRCRSARPLRCVIGDLSPGRRVTLRATYATRLRGRVVNRVAVHSATPERRLHDNRAQVALQVSGGRLGVCSARRRC